MGHLLTRIAEQMKIGAIVIGAYNQDLAFMRTKKGFAKRDSSSKSWRPVNSFEAILAQHDMVEETPEDPLIKNAMDED
jgi:hypothetical protein